MKIGIIDAEIIGKKNHRFPNLASMKISAWHKQNGDIVVLKTDYNDLNMFDRVYISKVFTDTIIPGEPEDKTKKSTENITEWYIDNEFLKQPNIFYGGTGFFYDESPNLPEEIEHIMPDYHLYDEWVAFSISQDEKQEKFKYYTDYSIGYLTRGCFRKCSFCVNKKYSQAFISSPLNEFLSFERKKICLLDDNFFAYKDWGKIIIEVKKSGKSFQFKQGLDIRLLKDKGIHEMMSWKYDNDFIFAFDDLDEKKTIESKLKRIFELYPNCKKRLKFYVFCGYDREDVWDRDFWIRDIQSVFERCYILSKYGALPYIMRYEKAYTSEFSSFYSCLSSWSNQPNIFKKFNFRYFSICRGMNNEGYKKYKRDYNTYLLTGGKKGSTWRNMEKYECLFKEWYDFVPDEVKEV